MINLKNSNTWHSSQSHLKKGNIRKKLEDLSSQNGSLLFKTRVVTGVMVTGQVWESQKKISTSIIESSFLVIRRILIGFNTRIRHFWYFLSYIFCFTFCLLFCLDGMFAVEKYKLLLPRLVKKNMHQTNTCFCDESLRAVYFQIKRVEKELKKFEAASISVLHSKNIRELRSLIFLVFLRDIAIL